MLLLIVLAGIWLAGDDFKLGQRGNLDFRSAPISHSSYYRYVIVVMLFLSPCSWHMCERIKLLMEKHTDCIGVVCGMLFWQLYFFFYFINKKEAASGTCFCGAKLVSLSLFDLFQMPVCLQCWTQPFSVLWKLKEAECSLLGQTLSANL